ncbi:MAG TPA: hypothetical protein VK999_07255, partial [Methylotenera sp.]|nr:hypothetical protein [Methylotenera sp.]
GRSPVVSGKLPGHYPARFEAVGKITNIDGYYTWSINGKKMNVSPNISIHSLVTANSSRYSIKQGMNIAYKTNSQGVITEAWEIPEDSIDLN